MAKCTHRLLVIDTELDRCSWVRCLTCRAEGPKKHSVILALIAWINYLGNDHPKRRKAAASRSTNFQSYFGDTQTAEPLAPWECTVPSCGVLNAPLEPICVRCGKPPKKQK